MTKILFGVAGEGFGHSSRAELIGNRLLKAGHEVMFAASAKSLDYLTPLFPDRVQKVHGLHFVVKNGKVKPILTLVDNIVKYRKGILLNRRLFSQNVAQFAPDLVFSDFEPFSAWWAWRNKIPCVFIDNEHLLTMAKLENVPGILDRFNAKVVTRGYHTRAKAYVIINFFKTSLYTEKAVLANPIIRKKVTKLKASIGSHITVYSTDSKPETRDRLIALFKQFPSHPFYIYGFKNEEQAANCVFKKISTDGFLNDLASCCGVVATAGFSLLSECMYLKKRMMVMPVKKQYEQKVNAVYADRLGFARHVESPDPDNLKLFMGDIEKPYPDDDRIIWPDNEAFFDILEQTLQKTGFDLHIGRTFTES